MSLPILNATPGAGELLRLFDKTELLMARQLAEEEPLSCGVGFANRELAGMGAANHVRDAWLPAGVSAEEAVGEVRRFFEGRGVRCGYWAMNRSVAAERVTPLVDHLVARGYVADRADVMYLRSAPRGVVKEVGGLTIISARASYRHARELAVDVARERGDGDVQSAADVHMLRLDDPQWDPILAIEDGRAVGRAYVLTAGEVGRIDFVYVVPGRRGRGTGRTLMSRALEACARSVFRHVLLAVEAQNVAAVGLYSRMGFERIGEVVRYVAPPG